MLFRLLLLNIFYPSIHTTIVCYGSDGLPYTSTLTPLTFATTCVYISQPTGHQFCVIRKYTMRHCLTIHLPRRTAPPVTKRTETDGNRRKRTETDGNGRKRTEMDGNGRKRTEIFYLTTHSTHFIYGYMASDIIWQRTTQIASKETRCRHMGYSFRVAARVILYPSSHRQDNTYHGLLHQSWSTARNDLQKGRLNPRTPDDDSSPVIIMYLVSTLRTGRQPT